MNNAIVPIQKQPPADINDTMTLGKVLADSGCFPDARAQAQAVVKVLAGRELGFPPVASMTGIHIIKGRVTFSAALIAAAIKRSGRYDYRVRKHNDQVCEIEFFEDGKSVGPSTFSMEDAKKAGLASGDNWKKYPRNMLFARAISNGAKWFCPDVFGGPVYTPDELDPKVKIDPETGNLLEPPPVVVEAEVIESEVAPEAEDMHACVLALVSETGTDVSKFLAHYDVPEIEDLSPAQCAEAIKVLTERKNKNQTHYTHK